MGINIIEDEEAEEEEHKGSTELVATESNREVAVAGAAAEKLDSDKAHTKVIGVLKKQAA